MAEPGGRTWEYRTLRPPRGETQKEAEDPEAALNDLGADGWELAETVDYTGGGTKYLVLKRPRDGGDGSDAGGSGGDTDRADETGSSAGAGGESA